MPSNDPNQRMFSITETAEWLGVSERFVYALIARGDLESFKLGRRRLIDRQDLERFIDDRREVQR